SLPPAGRKNSPSRRATPPAASSSVAALSRARVTPSPRPASGSPTRQWSSRSPRLQPPTGARHEKARRAVPAPLALLSDPQIRADRGCGRGEPLHRASALFRLNQMPRERLYLFDTTLRDGAQTNGVDFTLADKLAIARLLDELGVDYVEAGYPGANPIDTSFFAERRPLKGKVTAFGMTRRPGRSASNDPGLAALLAAEADAICFVAKSWDYHVRVALETSDEENLASIRDSVAAAKAKGRE